MIRTIHTLACTAMLLALANPLLAQDDSQETPAAKPAKPVVTEPLFEKNGRVIDAATGEPAVGVKVQAYGDNQFAAMTDDEGYYTIKVPARITSLSFSGDGYVLIQQAIGRLETLPTVQMYSSQFSETYRPRTVAATAHTADVTYLNNDITIDPQLQSSLGGDMVVTQRGGQPGLGVQMFMNGLNSLSSNAQPLVVIDGVVQNMQYTAQALHDGFFNNTLTGIMVEDIERISVLKNGTAIYGAKGANGVVIIETKRNKSMATKIDLSIGGSFELKPRLNDMMDADQYRVYASELIGTTGTKRNSFKFLQLDPSYYYYNIYHNNTDWGKEVRRNAWTQNYSINVQGGDDVANYNLSVGYAKSDATLKDFNFSRFNLRLNTDIVLMRNVTVRFDAAYSDVTRNLRDDGVKDNVTDGLISAPAFLSLIKSPFLAPYAHDASGNLSSYLAPADDYLSDLTLARSDYNISLANPLSLLDNAEGDNKNYFGNRLISLAVTPKWDINKHFSVADHFAFQLVNTDENYYQPLTSVPSYKVDGIGTVSNRVSAMAGRQITLMNDLYGTFAGRYGSHYVTARAGFRYLRDTWRQNAQIGYNSGNDKTPNMSTSLKYASTDGFDFRDTDLNYYLTADYNWRERYYLAASLSMNGSSKFGPDADDGVKIGKYAFGFFPSVEAAWVLTNESWFNPSSGINNLRLSAGFDLVGNDDINSIASRTYFTTKRVFTNLTGISFGNIGNTNLQWETTARFTFGIEGSFLKNRLHLAAHYFTGTTYDLLMQKSQSYVTGIKNNWVNSGSMHNDGFDIAADVKLINTRDWKWSIGASAGHYRNHIITLGAEDGRMLTTLYGATILSQEGQAAGVFYGYRTNGVFSTAEEASASGLYITDDAGRKQYFDAGDMRFVDVNGDQCIDENDMQIIGDPNPTLYGTFSTNLAWKRFALSANFTYSLGGDIYNYQRSILESGAYFYNQTTAMLSRWTHEGQQTDVPRASFFDPMGNSRFSDRWIEDGSFLKLKNVTLSYHLPVNSTYLQGITVWAAANNLFCLTKYLGSDPEVSATSSVLSRGIDRGFLAPGRSFSLGVKINL